MQSHHEFMQQMQLQQQQFMQQQQQQFLQQQSALQQQMLLMQQKQDENISKLTASLDSSRLPSQVVPNPAHLPSSTGTQAKPCQAVTALRSGRMIQKPTHPLPSDGVDEEEEEFEEEESNNKRKDCKEEG